VAKKMEIESLIRRAGGSKVEFGFHAAKKRVYHFKPVDSNDPDAAHVATVDNADDIASLLAIREGYRIYDPESPTALTNEGDSGEGSDDLTNQYDDILSITNPDQLSNEWLDGYCREVLEVEPNNRVDLTRIMADYNLDAKPKQPFASMIREIVKAQIAQEKQGSDVLGSQ
jgi:hypothetical protein